MKRVLIFWLIHFVITMGCIITLSGLYLQQSTGVQLPGGVVSVFQFFTDLLSQPMLFAINLWAAPQSMQFFAFLIVNSFIWAVALKYLFIKWSVFRKVK